MGKLLDIATELGQLVEEKSEAYGDSVSSSAAAFRLLYPNGIPPDRYLDALLVVRVWDKLMRIATRKDAFGENPWKDIAGYAIRGAAVDRATEESEPKTETLCACGHDRSRHFTTVPKESRHFSPYCLESGCQCLTFTARKYVDESKVEKCGDCERHHKVGWLVCSTCGGAGWVAK